MIPRAISHSGPIFDSPSFKAGFYRVVRIFAMGTVGVDAEFHPSQACEEALIMTPTCVVIWCFVYNFAATGVEQAIWLVIGTFTSLIIRCCLSFIMVPTISSALQTGKVGFVRSLAVFTAWVDARHFLRVACSQGPPEFRGVALASSAASCRSGYLTARAIPKSPNVRAFAFRFGDA